MSQPLSVEDLLKRKKSHTESLAKPRFLSRSEREKLALERRSKDFRTNINEHPSRPSIRDQSVAYNRTNGINREEQVPQDRSSNQTRSTAHTQRDKFRFSWEAEDDTLDDSDVLYKFASGGKNGKDVVNRNDSGRLPGGGIEERKRRQRELELFQTKKSKINWDDVHWSEKSLEHMKDRDWRIFKEDYKIVTKSSGGGVLPYPLRSWKDSNLPRSILDTIQSLGYKEPTAIQRAAIPIALQNRDVIGVAETGSGKTASFVIPLLVYIMSLPPLTEHTMSNGPYAIILAPTRELAQQIESEALKFSIPMGLRCVSLVGGHSIEEQVYKLQEGAEIVIATPGRLVDCIERRVLSLGQCCYVVMDEADRMVDLGFEEQLNKILAALPVTNEKPLDDHNDSNENINGNGIMENHSSGYPLRKYRQTMMYTATWPKAIERMAEKHLRRPGIVTIGNIGQATDRVEQRVEFINGEEKRKKRMIDILNSGKFSAPIIIFVNLRRNCDLVAKALTSAGWKAATMHGSKSQEQREVALSQLKSGIVDCLVATDVAGRGIDVPDVSLVINFQMARSVESYTHRIGRTGRAGKRGVAITFLGTEDEDVFYDLKIMLQRSGVTKIPEELRLAQKKANAPTTVTRETPQEE